MNEGGKQAETLENFPANGVIVDGLFGTGFRGAVSDPYLSLIALANHSGLPIISVDIPSGLNGETGRVETEAIIATETAFLGLPKAGFFLNDGWDHTGKLRQVDFGLDREYADPVQTDIIMLTEEILKPLMPQIRRSRHKYEAGYVVGVAGSPDMPGAAILASTAALRSGAGIVRLFHPEGMREQLAACPYELIHTPFARGDISAILHEGERAAAFFVGPGLGRTPETTALLRDLLPKIDKPCVIDADALFVLAEEKIPLPKQTVLTPHHGEMMRLLKIKDKPQLNLDFLKVCKEYATSMNITLVLKGAPTFILSAGYPYTVNPTGDPGMATAGSGDVLTGLIAGLLAQGMSLQDASALGVYLHGLAGEHAAADLTSYGVCASDIIYRFPEAFKFLYT
jgi:NAD(P)H-hydrate epimerase